MKFYSFELPTQPKRSLPLRFYLSTPDNDASGGEVIAETESNERVLVVAGDGTGVLSSEEPTGYKIDTEELEEVETQN